MKKIAIIGCGNLGLSLLKGLRSRYPEALIYGTRRHPEQLQPFADERTVFTSDNTLALRECDLVIVALKPFNVLEFMSTHANDFDAARHTVISVVTGKTRAELSAAAQLPPDSVYRSMPNTAADVQESMTALCGPLDQPERDRVVEELFGAVGQTVWIDEQLMESATILGACGIAYALRFIRAMIQGGIEVGFDAATAGKIVSQTVKGAAELLIRNGLHPEAEIDKVTTPKGCTIVGLNEMEHSGFSSALIRGIVTSYQKIER